MTRRGTNISLKSYEDIFTTEEKRQETGEQVVMIPVNQIHEFKNHPLILYLIYGTILHRYTRKCV